MFVDMMDNDLKVVWMIDPTDLPFPSVKIYEVTVNEKGKVTTKIIRDMHEAIGCLEVLLGADR